MKAYDRDGTLIGSPFEWAANHPKHLVEWPQLKLEACGSGLYLPVVRAISEPCVVISNQGGIGTYVGHSQVLCQFQALMERMPSIQRCYFSVAGGSNVTWIDNAARGNDVGCDRSKVEGFFRNAFGRNDKACTVAWVSRRYLCRRLRRAN